MKPESTLDLPPAPLEAKRKEIQRRNAAERDLRFAAFQSNLEAKASLWKSVLATGEPAPVTILAEGDSWFEYPVPFSGGGIIDHLAPILGDRVEVLNLATHGDEVRQILALDQRQEIEKRLSAPRKFDALLFSGGGNDIVGDQFCLWLNRNSGGLPPNALVNEARLNAVLGVVAAGYRDLIAIRDALSPHTKIFVHTYDFPQPSDEGVCNSGPWLKPSLDYRNINDPSLQFEVVRMVLAKFAASLQSIQGEDGVRDFYVVPTQGALNPKTEWANEIHPSRGGFTKLARKFQDALAQHWPQLRS